MPPPPSPPPPLCVQGPCVGEQVLRQELGQLISMRHPNLCSVLGACLDPGNEVCAADILSVPRSLL